MTSPPAQSFHSKGTGLSTVLAGSTTWERTLIPIGTAMRATLATATCLTTLMTAALYTAVPSLIDTRPPGFFLFGWPWLQTLLSVTTMMIYLYIAQAVVLLGLAVLTLGFSTAGKRLHIALAVIITITITSLLPLLGLLLIATANLITWAALIAAGIAAAIIVFFALIDGL